MFAATHQGYPVDIYLVVTKHATDCCRFVHIGIGHFVFNMIMQVSVRPSTQQSQHITLQYAKCYVTCSPRWILFIQFLPLLVNATTTPTNVSWEAGVGSNILSLKSFTIRSSHQISHSSWCWTFIDIHSRNKLPLTIWPHKKWSFTNIFIIHKQKLNWISVDISNFTFNSTVEFSSDILQSKTE